MPELIEELALLTDAEAHNVLNRLIEGYAARNPIIPVADEDALAAILIKIGEAAGETVTPRKDNELPDAAAAERSLLVELARNPTLRGYVVGAVESSRKVLIEPITTALVVAGIIFVLETQFDVKVSRKAGKTEYEVHVGKKPTDKSIIKKFFNFFTPK
jgi:hypothetical protein